MTEDHGQSQSIRAVLGLRSMIVQGELKPGERVLEQTVVERLGVSRTPARMALAKVCEQGLLEALSVGGYAVASFAEADVFDAIAIRGNLEGMAARLAAERGVPVGTLGRLRRCVDELDRVVARLQEDPDLTGYVRLNDQFHELLVDASQSLMVKRSLERLMALPFAAPNAFVSVSNADTQEVRNILIVAQDQHRSILDAMERREGARAEALAIEHSRSAWKYLERVFEADSADRAKLPGMNLVVRNED